MKFLASLLVVALCWAGASAADTQAQAKCRALHHVDVDPGTSYSNSQCLLRCIIHGKTSVHEMNEGLACPLASSGVCQHGVCVQRSSSIGHIDINIVSASLSRVANAYTTVCIQNSSVPLTLPIQNRASCVSCSSRLISSSHPVWNDVCAGSGNHVFVSDSRVTFEVWDSHGAGAANKIFLGGASLTIPQLLSHGDNHRELHLALTGGSTAGQVNARVTWTPK